MTQPGADPLVGRTVAHYEIVARLGGGGMGVVYHAIDRKLGRAVALKFLPQQWSHDEGAKQRFLREAQAASATDHPNICTIHDIATADDGQLFIVMARYSGDTLKRRLEAGPLPIDEALDIATQVADGLARAHAQGVVHRDIKPGNLILTEDGVRIVDFGLATFVDALQLTAEGSTLGTAAYMSPEQVRGEEVDARADVWAVGVVLYQMLVGHPPFRGAYAEAIGYAIRHDPPPALRGERPEIPEEVEQLVFRALHKDPAIRFQSGRELARALRQVRGLTVPQDLRTVAVDVAAARASPISSRRTRRALRAAYIVAAVLLTGTPVWLLIPVERRPVAVVPMTNGTGYPELDDQRMALTQELVSQLADARAVRVLPFDRLLEIVHRFRGRGSDVTGSDAVQEIAKYSGAELLLVPSLVRENGGWKARVEFRDAANEVVAPAVETAAVPTALAKETAYRLTVTLAERLQESFTAGGPRRAYFADRLKALTGRGRPRPSPRFQLVAAAALFEQGLSAYEQGEYAAAREAFGAAADADPRDPVSLAWRSRVATLMRQTRDAGDATERAAVLLTDQIRPDDRLFVEAVVAEGRHQADVAGDRYRALVERYPDEPSRLMDLAGFLDRQGQAIEARALYRDALDLDAHLPRANLELCRLDSPSRLNDPALAKQWGDTALTRYRNRGNLAGEAQAHWCLADVLRAGDDNEKRAAAQHAEDALRIMQGLAYPYGLARAYNYVAQVALSDRNAARAAEFYEKTLTSARAVGNVLLESRTIMNLGVSYEMLGRRPAALKAYQDGFAIFEQSGNQQDAALTQANAAGILIEHGRAPEIGLRDAQNALLVFQTSGDKRFEVFARRLVARYRRYTGDHAAALGELSIAQNLARERNLDGSLTQVVLDLARLRIDTGDYDAARELLLQVEPGASGTDAVHARIELARANTRLGAFDDAASDLTRAESGIREFRDPGSLPLLYAAQGELAYERQRLDEARASFAKASDFWTDDLPEAASVEARAYVGLIDSVRRQAATSGPMVRQCLLQAQTMRRLALEARCRVLLAQVEMNGGRADEALRVLNGLREGPQAELSPELRAQVHYWRSRALARQGDLRAAAEHLATARTLLDDASALLSEPYRTRVRMRPDFRLISQP